MPFVAHAGIKIGDRFNKNNTWSILGSYEDVELRWKYDSDDTIHIIGGIFHTPQKALLYAKILYTTLFFFIMREGYPIEDAGCSSYEPRIPNTLIDHLEYYGEESYFFWNKNLVGGGKLGPGVFEVNSSIDEFNEYPFYKPTISISYDTDIYFKLDNIMSVIYTQEAQQLFNAIVSARNSYDYGLSMTIYCGILEHLSDNADKPSEIISAIDWVINIIDESKLSQSQKKEIINPLNNSKKISSRKKCQQLCFKYAKPYYHGVSCDKIISAAYSIRSSLSHGESCYVKYIGNAKYTHLVILDVVQNYLLSKQEEKRGNIYE